MTSAIPLLRRCLAPLTVSMLLCAPALGQELYALGGAQYTRGLDEYTYSFLYEYLHNLDDHVFATFTWLNEGHVTDHHRDGLSGQIWLRWLNGSRRFTLSLGAGPYRYYDTTYLTPSGTVTDAHDWGALYSAAAHWYFRHPWVLQVRYNYAHTTTSITTHTLLIGVGYQFEASTRLGPVAAAHHDHFTSSERNEISAMFGNSVLNNFHSPHGVAWAVELRHRLIPHIDVTATLMDEGDTHAVKRHGVAGEGWLVREFLDGRADVGLGGGFYLARDDDEKGSKTRTLGLVTMTMTYRWSHEWSSRLYWYRTVTTNGRDTDVVLGSVGYAF